MSEFHEAAHLRAEIGCLNEIIAQRDRTIRDLRAALVPQLSMPRSFNLTAGQAKVALCLMANAPRLMKKEAINHAIHDGECKISAHQIDVYVCHIRRKLHAYAITIETVLGSGYRMTAESAARLAQLIEQDPASAVSAVPARDPMRGAAIGHFADAGTVLL